MNGRMSKYDPWGPISSTLYSLSDSDLVETVIGYTGVPVQWPRLDDRTGYSHGTRVRAYKPAIQTAYEELEDEEKGRFAQIVAKNLLEGITYKDRRNETKDRMREALNQIGWTITDEGRLITQDPLLSEQFFPPGTPYDAYVAIRSILERAANHIMIIDAYMGSSLFATLGAVNAPALSVQLLTTANHLRNDFHVESTNFRRQFPNVNLEVRSTNEFHDRFIVIDDNEYFHVGASIKDAGARAFLISRLQDQPVTDLVRQHIDQAWANATPFDRE